MAFLKRRGEIWYIYWEQGGKKHGRSLRTKHKLVADEYLKKFDDALESGPADFRPQLVLVSAGFDGVEGDPTGGLRLVPGTYAELTRRLVALAKQCGHERVVSVLEGGYELKSLAECVRAHFDELP